MASSAGSLPSFRRLSQLLINPSRSWLCLLYCWLGWVLSRLCIFASLVSMESLAHTDLSSCIIRTRMYDLIDASRLMLSTLIIILFCVSIGEWNKAYVLYSQGHFTDRSYRSSDTIFAQCFALLFVDSPIIWVSGLSQFHSRDHAYDRSFRSLCKPVEL